MMPVSLVIVIAAFTFLLGLWCGGNIERRLNR